MTQIPDTALIPAAEEGLQQHLQEIPETVVLPESMPLPENVKWPVRDATAAAAVVATLQNRRARIAQIKEMAKSMVAHEETEIRRLMFAVGGYQKRLGGDRVKESWGTLEQWTKEQIAARGGREKFADTPFGRLAFRSVPDAVFVSDSNVEKFCDWCMRTGHTELFKVTPEVCQRPLLDYMRRVQKKEAEPPMSPEGALLVEYFPAGRTDNFIVGKEES